MNQFRLALFVLQLFFWFFPPGPEGSLDDLIFWYVVNFDDSFARVVLRVQPGILTYLQGLTEVLAARR